MRCLQSARCCFGLASIFHGIEIYVHIELRLIGYNMSQFSVDRAGSMMNQCSPSSVHKAVSDGYIRRGRSGQFDLISSLEDHRIHS